MTFFPPDARVEFARPVPEDGDAAMVVVEDRGDRVLVVHLVDLPIRPTSVYLKSDLVLVGS